MAREFVLSATGKYEIDHDPNDVLDYYVNFANELNPLGDSIADATVTVDGITKNSHNVLPGNTKVCVWLTGGDRNVKPKATCTIHIVTANTPPREYDQTFYLKIKEN